MRLAVILSLLLSLPPIIRADQAEPASSASTDVKSPTKPTKEEMAKVAEEAWGMLDKSEASPSARLDEIVKSMGKSYQTLIGSLSAEQSEAFKDVLERADKHANKLVPAANDSGFNFLKELGAWRSFLKGNPRHLNPPPLFNEASVAANDKHAKILEEYVLNAEVAYYGHTRPEFEGYKDDEYQAWLKYDGRLKSLILDLVKEKPERAKEWTKIGDDLSLESFRKALSYTKAVLAEREKAAKTMTDFAIRRGLFSQSKDNEAKAK